MENSCRTHEDAAASCRTIVATGLGPSRRTPTANRPGWLRFSAFHTSRRPLCENTINQAFRRMGFAVGEIIAHGLRTTASTLLNESGKWSPDAIEHSLAHADKDAVRGIYNRGRYWDERVAMHQWWSDYLDDLRATPAAKAL